MKKKLKNSKLLLLLVFALAFVMTGCSLSKRDGISKTTETTQEITEMPEQPTGSIVVVSEDDTQTEAAATKEETETELTTEEEIINPYENIIVAIDAGHQRYGNSDREPIGPGATETKAKVSGGTRGVASGLAEYELNLIVALKLKDRLTELGYQVVMVRESHDVDISNSERAAVANNAGADVFLRIHANGSENSGANGILTMCQTAYNPYCSDYYEDSYRLANCLLEEMVASTGAKSCGVSCVDNMSGINYCQVPVTIIEMGFMTNPDEDMKLANDDYQNLIVDGIIKGLDKYFEINDEE